MLKKILRFCFFSTAGVTAIITIWAILGNLIAAKQEKPIEVAQEEFRKEFNIRTEPNKSALKLEALTSKLGVLVSLSLDNKSTRYLHSSGTQTTEFSDEKFKQELRDYINSQVQKSNKDIDIPPAKLQKFLNSHASLLAEIENHILNNELPEWEFNDFANNNYVETRPSLLNFVGLQNLLFLKILEKTRQGKHQEAEKSIEASWKLSQVLLKRPDQFSQVVYFLITKSQIPIMRKMPTLSPVWISRFERDIKYNIPQSFLNSLRDDSFIVSNNAKEIPISWTLGVIRKVEEDINGKPTDVNLMMLIGQLFLFKNQDYKIAPRYYLQLPYLFSNSSQNDLNFGYFIYNSAVDVILKPYLRLSAVNDWKRNTKFLQNFNQNQNNYCSLQKRNLTQTYQTASEFWSIDDNFDSSFISLLRKMLKSSLDMELTQKIIQIQEIAKKQGSWPKQVPGIESSSVCQDAKWIYRVDDSGTMSIELKDQFSWLSNLNNSLPLKYSAKYPDK